MMRSFETKCPNIPASALKGFWKPSVKPLESILEILGENPTKPLASWTAS